MKKTEVTLVLGSLAITFFLIEVLLRALMVPSTISTGLLFGREIPPIRPVPGDLNVESIAASRHEEPYRDLEINGKQITHGDLFGVMREDQEIAYVPLENFESLNGWWKSNNLGARSDSHTDFQPTKNRKRVLMFGDSYTQGSRIKQKESFAAILDQSSSRYEYLNFGVDGYSTGQAYLRYLQVKHLISFDDVILTLVPTADLWRDISVSRYFGDRWVSYKLQPRFDYKDGNLKPVKSPFRDLASQLEDGPDFTVSREHLLLHDSFYFQEYEPSPLADISVTYRVLKAAIASSKRKWLHRDIRDPSGEAVAVTRAIISEMTQDVTEQGAEFKLVILPTFTDIMNYQSNAKFRKEWGDMSDVFCATVDCIEIISTLSEYKIEEFDFGYDGTHYGPKINKVIADAIGSMH